jgi:hypothetical protein
LGGEIAKNAHPIDASLKAIVSRFCKVRIENKLLEAKAGAQTVKDVMRSLIQPKVEATPTLA